MTSISIRLLDPVTDTREPRTFAVPSAGGYVIEVLPPDHARLTSDRPQVCERLQGYGNTLLLYGDATAARLRVVIRREQRRRLAAYRRLGRA